MKTGDLIGGATSRYFAKVLERPCASSDVAKSRIKPRRTPMCKENEMDASIPCTQRNGGFHAHNAMFVALDHRRY